MALPEVSPCGKLLKQGVTLCVTRTTAWNPRMGPFTYGARNGIQKKPNHGLLHRLSNAGQALQVSVGYRYAKAAAFLSWLVPSVRRSADRRRRREMATILH